MTEKENCGNGAHGVALQICLASCAKLLGYCFFVLSALFGVVSLFINGSFCADRINRTNWICGSDDIVLLLVGLLLVLLFVGFLKLGMKCMKLETVVRSEASKNTEKVREANSIDLSALRSHIGVCARIQRYCSRLQSVLFGIGAAFGFYISFISIGFSFRVVCDASWLDEMLNLVFMVIVPFILAVMLTAISVGCLKIAKKCTEIEATVDNEAGEPDPNRPVS